MHDRAGRRGHAGSTLDRRALLAAGVGGLGGFGFQQSRGDEPAPRHGEDTAKGGAAAADEEADSVLICPFQLTMKYNGYYYYSAYSCDPNHQGSTITSSVPLSPLGCT